MNRAELKQLIETYGDAHQVFRIIQLDRRSGQAGIPQATIQWAATVELIMAGSNTKLTELPLS